MAKKANGEGSITTRIRNGKKYYTGTVTVGKDEQGKQIKKNCCSFKKSEVIRKMDIIKAKYLNLEVKEKETKFGLFFKKWIYNFKRIEVSNNTFAEYEATYRLRIEPYFIARLKLGQLTIMNLQKYFNILSEEYSNYTVEKTFIQVQTCIKFASKQGLVTRNLCENISIKRNCRSDKFNVFSKKEQLKIESSLDLTDIVDCAILFDFYTGLRLSELLGLTWNNIDGNFLEVKKQWKKSTVIDKNGERKIIYELSELKTKNSKRIIPLPNKALNLLERLKKNKNCEIVFSIDKKHIERKRLQRKIKKLCKELNIEVRSFHSIRHSYATRLFEAQVQAKTIQMLLGHSDIATTLDIYTHVFTNKKVQDISVLDEL